MYSRETKWGSYDGRYTKICDLEDTHLANVILHVSKRSEEGDPLLAVLKEEAKIRGLKDAFLERAQIPHRGNDGSWYVWDYEKSLPVKVG